MNAKRRLGFEPLESRRMLTAVDIPDDLTGAAASQVVAPINIDDAAEIRAAEIRLTYDTSLLDINETDITAGSVWGGDATVDVVASVDEAAGTIIVSIFGAEGLPATGGSLVNFQFTVQAGAAVGASSVIDLTEVRLNEGAIALDTTPQPGPDATDGLLTVTEDIITPPGDGIISGTVYADVNNNNQPDSTEGLPGVTIILINTTTNEQTQTTTQSDGRYQFTSVAAGSYRIQELQPAAYLDGGTNEISVEFTADQSLTGQDFRELGLRPEFIYNRLFTTLVMPIGSTNWVSAITQINTDAENGVVNAQIVTTTSTISEGEGEATITADSPMASPPVVTTSVLDAEGEAPVADVTAEPRLPTKSETATLETESIIVAEGEGSTELIVVASNLDAASELLAPAVCTVSDLLSVSNVGASVFTASSTEPVEVRTNAPAANAVDFVLSEFTAPLETAAMSDATEDDLACVLSDEILAIDEVFAVTDSW